MKKLVFALLVFAALSAFVNGMYGVGVAFLIVTVCLYGFVFYVVLESWKLYFRLSTDWHDVTQISGLAKNSWFLNHEMSYISASWLYHMIASHDTLFDVSVNVGVVHDYERSYSDVRLSDRNASSMSSRALHYYVKALKKNPERLPEIAKAIMVRKTPHGETVRRKVSLFLTLAFG